MKKILVTGCNGQLGRAINEVYKNEQAELINTDVADLDITDVSAVIEFVKETNPNVIINCAAHTNVNACESEWDLAYKINAIGPRNLSIASAKTGAKLIHVSTDYVFDGTSDIPYTEFSKVSPLGAYGKTKLAGEEFVKQFAGDFFIIRTAWLYGDGKNFVKTMLSLAEKNDEVSVVKDQVGSPTSAMELARMIKYLEPTDNYGVFHGTCEGACSWADFAEEIFKLAGKTTRVKHITTEEFPTPAKRPAYSVLDNYMLKLTTDYKFADWKDALKEYMS
ncbi:MAG: dTDP-4-dehydrorhamnose reductase [Clostridium sp.]|nr:dTDP-4-dehydrorhamnose reductase [Clostridium sp.]MCM1400024.1 dTDP-4-dehydrorhamnose reductase [Clostridium sp.]MCM1459796.1 dTDP-4-dehydrorhamnose reductase [Bacteroides sp.]